MKRIIVFIAIIGLSACSKKNIETSAQVSMIDGKPAVTVTVQPKSETKPQISITEDDVRKALETSEPPVPVEFDIFFDFDSASLKPESMDMLESISTMLKFYSGLELIIEGHTDERGTEEYNLALGDRRSTCVKKYLEKLGVNTDKYQIVSYGEEKPFADGNTEESYKLNRRVHAHSK